MVAPSMPPPAPNDKTRRVSYLEARRILGGNVPPPAMPSRVETATSKPKRPRSGGVTEALLCAALDSCGLIDAANASSTTPAGIVYVREFAWGMYLSEPRLFRFDAAVPARRLAFEVDGGAHAAGRAKVKSDTERRGLAASNGWRVVALTPEQVTDGRAVPIVRRALGMEVADA